MAEHNALYRRWRVLLDDQIELLRDVWEFCCVTLATAGIPLPPPEIYVDTLPAPRLLWQLQVPSGNIYIYKDRLLCL